MKKKRLLWLPLLAPFALLVGCGGSMKLGFSPNWYQDNTVENVLGKDETLVYEVTFRPAETDDGVRVNYGTGSYVTTLTAENYSTESETVQAYHFHSRFDISGYYERGSERGEAFDDSMESDVWFTRTSEGFRPLKSQKTVHATVPYSEQGSDEWSTPYVFTYDMNYATDVSEVEYKLDITLPEAHKRTTEGKIELDNDYSVLDNEQIVMGLRGLSLSASNTNYAFETVDPQTQQAVSVNTAAEAQTTAVSFTLGDEKVETTLDAIQFTCTYASSHSGPSRKFLYAARTDESTYRYRSVLLSFENPVMYNLGTMTYTLKKATFNG